ncbi:SHOCT domain-containing protein [Halovivax sp.]|uniref:SHOCT domain-containing protein n=1 Tax=Halovivax sp. TaxID=1935978 RepID=UPI0025C09F97|nr:SHOCT domain-containing protein [Halovivax sp.]
MSDDPATRLRQNATEIASLLVTGLWLGLLFSGIGGTLWLVVLLVGYIVVVPLVALLYGDEADVEEWWDEDELERIKLGEETETTKRADSSARDALETLRNRYAAGELTDEQFERKLEHLLETETLEDVAERRGATGSGPSREPDVEFER